MSKTQPQKHLLDHHFHTGRCRRWIGVLLAFAALGSSACASRNVQTGGCEDNGDCNPGYICNSSGDCVSGTPDAGAIDAMILVPTDALPPDGSLCAEASFQVSETEEAFVVPPNARYMHVKAWGAGGNAELGCSYYDNGGQGGYSEAVFEVVPGDPLIVIVGKSGLAGSTEDDIVRFGFGHWGGGGLSGVFHGPDPITEHDSDRALIIAGGGGSAGAVPLANECVPGGSGNHPDAGGMPTMMGGPGGDDVNGGAGGHRGGPGGAAGEAGVGGTGHVDDVLQIDSKMLHSEPGQNPPPNTEDPDWDGIAGTTEESGLVIIRFICTLPPPM